MANTSTPINPTPLTDIANTGRYAPTAELILIIGTLAPLLTHPFLPAYKNNSPHKASARQPSFPICAFSHFCLIHLPNFFLWVLDAILPEKDSVRDFLPEFVILPRWILCVNFLCWYVPLFAGPPWRQVSEKTRDDFEETAGVAEFVLGFELIRVSSIVCADATSSWVLGAMGGFSAWIFLMVFLDLPSRFDEKTGESLGHPTVTATWLYRFTSRREKRWSWLPQNGAAEDFRPDWSRALEVLTLSSAVVVAVGYYWALWR
ncbi:hypothetical protein B0T16DRAFT_414413 [Cercophora newfieldiana]|uniref:Uncharacterized protein n=1 Tax=Cercophora newfieldiana TaxID=92897 RepID=A0AA39Y6D0_9PEZI|nr:hypothetical protein B0T16DRAFT_414413 [Cercophora newfieldiana]